MLNTELIEYLLDIYTPAEVALFCEMEAYKCLLSNEDMDTWGKEDYIYHHTWFSEKARELRNKIKLEAQLPRWVTF